MKDDDGERFLRALRETLDTVVTPIVRDALIHDALILAGMLTLPNERKGMLEFAQGPLRAVTERALGVELAESVADEIARMTESTRPTSAPPPPVFRRSTPAPRTVRATPGYRKHSTPVPSDGKNDTLPGHRAPSQPPARPESSERHPTLTPVPRGPRRRAAHASPSPWPVGLGSHIRRPRDAEAPAAPAPAEGVHRSTASGARSPIAAQIPCVLVATEDPQLIATLGEWFENRALVVRVQGVLELVRTLDGIENRRTIVVLDGKSPSIRPTALAVLVEELAHVDVMMCRAAPATEQVVLAASQASARWLVYREPASLDHIAAECLRLVS